MISAPGIYLLRHGETTAGAAFIGSTDAALTEQGWQQMQLAVNNSHFERIISSPLRRCAIFAEWLGSAQGISVVYEARWREIDFGNWEGYTAAELMQTEAEALQQLWTEPETFVLPGGEAIADFRRRVLAAWSDHGSGNNSQTLIIAHGGVIRVLLSALYPERYGSIMQIEVAHGSLHSLDNANTAVSDA